MSLIKKVLVFSFITGMVLNVHSAYAQTVDTIKQKICYQDLLDLSKKDIIPSDQFIKLLSNYDSKFVKILKAQKEIIESKDLQKIVYNLIPNHEDFYQELNKQIFHFNIVANSTPETVIFDYAWNDAYCFLFFAATNMYQLTKDIRYANLVADFYLQFLPKIDKKLGFIDETRGRSLEAWSTLSYGYWKSAVSWNAALLYPGIRLIQLGALPYLSESRKKTLLELKKIAPKVMSEFESEFYCKDDQTGYYFNPYSGYTEAFNRQALMILLYGQMYDLYKDLGYKEKHNRMVAWFRKSLALKQGKSSYYAWSYSKTNPTLNHLGDEIPGEALNKASLTLQILFDQSSLNSFTDTEKKYFANNFLEQIALPDGKWNHFTSLERNDFQELIKRDYQHILAWYPLSIQNPGISTKIENFVANNSETFSKGWLSNPRSIFYLTQRLLYNLSSQKGIPKKLVQSFTTLPESVVTAIGITDRFIVVSGNSKNIYFLAKDGQIIKKIVLKNVITCFLKTKKGELFAGSADGHLLHLDSNSLAFDDIGSVSDDIWSLIDSEDGGIYAGTSKGLFSISLKPMFKSECILNTRRILALNGNEKDVFFVGQDKSLFGVNNTKLFMKTRPILTEGRALATYENNVFMGGIDGHIYVLDKATGSLINTIKEVHTLPITAMATVGNSLFSIGLDGNIRQLDMKTGEKLNSSNLAPEQFRCLANDNGIIFIGGSGGRIYKIVSS